MSLLQCRTAVRRAGAGRAGRGVEASLAVARPPSLASSLTLAMLDCGSKAVCKVGYHYSSLLDLCCGILW